MLKLCAASFKHRCKNSCTGLAAAEASKRLKYEEICTDRSLGFVPFAMSVWGTLGEATGPVIELVTDSLVERLMMAKSVVTYRVRSFLVGSVMRQIATNGLEALARIRSRAVRAVARRVYTFSIKIQVIPKDTCPPDC